MCCGVRPTSIRERNHELSVLETLDTGKPLQETLVADAASGADCLEHFGSLIATDTTDHIPLGGSAGSSFAYTRREPLGVCVGIGAWNYPIQIACWKAAPALAAGNAMIFKPSEVTPLSALQLPRSSWRPGCPAGAFNVVQGAGDVGAALVSHPGVAKVSVTGSVPTGERVAATAAAGLKHVTLELGGKSPLIVFDDAQLDNAVSGAMLGNFYSAGQVCSNGTRVFVHRGVYDEFVARVAARAEQIALGDPLDEATQMGPLVERAPAREGAWSTSASGATTTVLGSSSAGVGSPGGLFVEPTVFADVTDGMRIAREEIFGPVMCVLPFDDEDEVVARANATSSGSRPRCSPATSPRPPRDRPARSRDVLDQHVQPDADRDAVRRLQALGDRPRERPRRARSLQPDQERLRRDRRRRRALLTSAGSTCRHRPLRDLGVAAVPATVAATMIADRDQHDDRRQHVDLRG